MSQLPDASSPPGPPKWLSSATSPWWSDRLYFVLNILAVSVMLSCAMSCVFLAVGAPTALNGLPEPTFNRGITYTPEQGPPNPALLDSRPERIVERYLADYLLLERGTYPCTDDLSRYQGWSDLIRVPCPISRPVARYASTTITIQPQGLLDAPDATVRFVITYQDGSQWASQMVLGPDRRDKVGFFYIHLDCWSSQEPLTMFGNLVPDIPPGAGYGPPGAGPILCQH